MHDVVSHAALPAGDDPVGNPDGQVEEGGNHRFRVAAKALAARHELPPRHLETVLQALVRVGILKGVRGIAFHHFESCDVVRHPLVQKIVDAYDSWQKQHEPKADA